MPSYAGTQLSLEFLKAEKFLKEKNAFGLLNVYTIAITVNVTHRDKFSVFVLMRINYITMQKCKVLKSK